MSPDDPSYPEFIQMRDDRDRATNTAGMYRRLVEDIHSIAQDSSIPVEARLSNITTLSDLNSPGG